MLLPGEELGIIYRKTNGSCRVCGRPLSLDHYGHPNEKGGWEIVHEPAEGIEDRRWLERAYPVHVACHRRGAPQRPSRTSGLSSLRPRPTDEKREMEGAEPSLFGALGGAIIGGVLGGAETVMVGVSAGILVSFGVRRALGR